MKYGILMQAAGESAPAPAGAPAAPPATPAPEGAPPAAAPEAAPASPPADIAALIAAEFEKRFPPQPSAAPAAEPERPPAGPSFDELQRLARRDPVRLLEMLGVQDRKGFANRALLAELGEKAPPEWRQSVEKHELQNRLAELEARLEAATRAAEEKVTAAETRRIEQDLQREVAGWVKADLGAHGHLAMVAEKNPARAQALLWEHTVRFVNEQRRWPVMADIAAAVDKDLAELGVAPRSAPAARTPASEPAVEMQSRPPVEARAAAGKNPADMNPEEFAQYITGKLRAGV